MKEISFSKKTKDILSGITPKKGCCRRTEKKLREALEGGDVDYDALREAENSALCRECSLVFLRQMFIKFGTVTAPEKSYHLEMSFRDRDFRDFVCDTLSEFGLNAKRGTRRDRFTLYFKDSGAIEDFFATLGAQSTAFDMMNLKLVKEVRGGINRQNNFETANIQKTAVAVIPYIHAIQYLTDNGYLGGMSEELRETARLRLENDTASIASLASLHNPPISKSGVKHRLDKIMDYYRIVTNRRGV